MSNIWDERKKALENEYFQRQEREKIEKLRKAAQMEQEQNACHNRCPKCGQQLEAMNFREVPLDKCPDCGGVWLGPKDLQILAEKDHRTWFEKWFGEKEEPSS
jgi:uncharacterized protein